jgi:hypothetical protein
MRTKMAQPTRWMMSPTPIEDATVCRSADSRQERGQWRRGRRAHRKGGEGQG